MLQELQAEAASAVLHSTSFLVSLRQMFRPLRRHLLNLRLFLYRSEFTGFYFVFFVCMDRKGRCEEFKYLCCVSLKAHWEEAVSLVSANTHRYRNKKISNKRRCVAWIPAPKSPLSPLLAAWQSCQGRHLAFPRSPPSTSLHQHSPGWHTARCWLLMPANSVLCPYCVPTQTNPSTNNADMH